MLEEPAARSQCSIEAPAAHVPVTPVQAPLSIEPGGQKVIVAHTPAERAVSRLTCQGMSSRTELGGQKETVVNTPAERAVSRLTCQGMPSRSIAGVGLAVYLRCCSIPVKTTLVGVRSNRHISVFKNVKRVS